MGLQVFQVLAAGVQMHEEGCSTAPHSYLWEACVYSAVPYVLHGKHNACACEVACQCARGLVYACVTPSFCRSASMCTVCAYSAQVLVEVCTSHRIAGRIMQL